MSYRTINEDILRTLRMPGPAYWGVITVLVGVLLFGVYAFWTQTQLGLGVAGYEHPAPVGHLHHKLRLLGRHRPLGYADLRGALPVQGPMADRRCTRR